MAKEILHEDFGEKIGGAKKTYGALAASIPTTWRK